MQLNKLRQKLEVIAKELEVANKETFLSSVATERAAELASSQLFQPSGAAPSGPADTAQKAEGNGKLKPKAKTPKKQMKPQVDELEEAERKPTLFEPAAGPPPKVGEEELAAEGSGQEILLQVGLCFQNWLPAGLHSHYACFVCNSRFQHCQSWRELPAIPCFDYPLNQGVVQGMCRDIYGV